jgi:hypothetical protein
MPVTFVDEPVSEPERMGRRLAAGAVDEICQFPEMALVLALESGRIPPEHPIRQRGAASRRLLPTLAGNKYCKRRMVTPGPE